MAAIGTSDHILFSISYQGPMVSDEGLRVTAIKIACQTRGIIAQLPKLSSTDAQKTCLYKGVECSKEELARGRFFLVLASEIHTADVLIARAPLPKLYKKQTIDITVHYDGKSSWPFVTFSDNISVTIEALLSKLNVFTKQILQDVSFDVKNDEFHDLMDCIDILYDKIKAALKDSRAHKSKKRSIDLSCKETLSSESRVSSSQPLDIPATHDESMLTNVTEDIIHLVSELMRRILANASYLRENPDATRLKNSIKTLYSAVSAAIDKSPATALLHTYWDAEQMIKKADDAYDSALKSKNSSVLEQAIKECKQAMARFNEIVDLLKKQKIPRQPTEIYKHMRVVASTDLIEFKKPIDSGIRTII